jgi:EAL domain-containing protein (putative c-di-GMP-specific phosphodiesterase class I)
MTSKNSFQDEHKPELRTVFLDHTDLIGQPGNNAVPDILHAIRTHLQMEVGFVSEFIDGKRIFRYVDSDWKDSPVKVGYGNPLEESFCQQVVNGVLPELMHDARTNPIAALMPVTMRIPVGAHMSIPIHLADGSVYGTFCCFSRNAEPSLNLRDLSLMRVFAELAGKMIDREHLLSHDNHAKREKIDEILKKNALSIVYQPIFNLIDWSIDGFESLTRFTYFPEKTPDMVFNEAHTVGRGVELETRAIELTLQDFPHFSSGTYLAINASPATIMGGTLEKLFGSIHPLNRLTLEITEHAVVSQYKEIAAILHPYRKRGLKIAIDDAGAGYASFRHILNLAPDRIKLDMSLTRDIDTDPARRALAVAFTHFSQDTGCKLIAEGVETAAELATIKELGIQNVQGYFLGRPMTLQNIAKKLR